MGLLNLWVGLSLLYVAFAIIAPLFEHLRISAFSFFYLFLKTSCHQIPGRCFWIFGSDMGLCAKCLGLYLAQPSILLFLRFPGLTKKINLIIATALILFFPMLIDSTVYNFSNSNTLRFYLGFCAGIGLGMFLIVTYIKWGNIMDQIYKKRKFAIISITVFLYLTSISNILFAQDKEYVMLRSGTPLMLEFIDTIDSERYKMGQTVPMVVSRSIRVDDHIVIITNTEVYAKVSACKEAAGWGGRGEIAVAIESTYAVDGQEILISGSQHASGDTSHGSATAVAVGTGLICLPLALTGFAIKGEQGVIPEGMTVKARVDSDYKIAVVDYDKMGEIQTETSERIKEKKDKLAEQRLKWEKEKEEKRKRLQQGAKD
jgi:uncharacterized membrane protein